MDWAIGLLVLLHLIGFASLFGGLIVQARASAPEVNAAMLHGGLTVLVSGLALVVLARLAAEEVDWVKIAVKLIVTVVVVGLLLVNRRFLSIPRGLWALLTALTLANAAIAVLWQ